MKRLLIALLSMSLVTVGGITASAQTNEAEPVIANAAVSCSALANCPNNGIPALDGTGYQGGRNEDFVNSITTDSSTDSTTGTGINPNCPNNGIPPRDGTGYQGGRNEDFVSSATTDSSTDSTTGTCPNPNCPNDGIPPRDGTGYQGGQGQNSFCGQGQGLRNGNGNQYRRNQ